MTAATPDDNPKPTRQQRSAQIGITLQCLKNWERSGVDVWSDDDVRAKVAKMRNLPETIKPEFMPKAATVPIGDGDDPTEIDIEAIIQNLSQATDKHVAQTVKMQIDGLLNAYKLREAAGKYVSRALVDEALIRMGAILKAALKRMESDLPPMLDGASPAQIKELIRAKVDEVLNMIHDEQSEIWRDQSTTS